MNPCNDNCIPFLEPPPPVVIDNIPCNCPPLKAGTYANATITVNGGCIVDIKQGEPFKYEPQICCCDHTGGGGSGMQGLRGKDGKDGENATISLRGVNIVGSDQPAAVRNLSGDNTHVLLEFDIPRTPIDTSLIPVIDGVSGTVLNGLEYEDGLLKSVDSVALANSLNNISITGEVADGTSANEYVIDTEVSNPSPTSLNHYSIRVDGRNFYNKIMVEVDDKIGAIALQQSGTGGDTTTGLLNGASYSNYMNGMKSKYQTYTQADVKSWQAVWIALGGDTTDWGLYNTLLAEASIDGINQYPTIADFDALVQRVAVLESRI